MDTRRDWQRRAADLEEGGWAAWYRGHRREAVRMWWGAACASRCARRAGVV